MSACPNCESAMNCADDPCPECDHNGGDPGCECAYCEDGREETAASFIPAFKVRALARRVLCVSKTRITGEWAAYVDAVPGKRHEDEWEEVARTGSKLDEPVARLLFPEYVGRGYAP
jgi:hypothetical protein